MLFLSIPGLVVAAAPERLPAPKLERPASKPEKHSAQPDLSFDVPAIPSILPPGETYPIDLPTALQLAETANPQLGSSRESVREAAAIYRGSRVLLLPNLNAGTNYHQHNGVLQTSFGLMRNLTEQSVYVGGGARALAAETVAIPMVQVFSHLGDALFTPLAARQEVAAASANASATENSVLLAVATAYLRLASAEARLEAWNISRVQLYEIVNSTRAFAKVGQGREGDYKRALSEALLMQSQQQGAQAEVYIASNELARLLRLDPAVRLTTFEGPIEILELVDPQAQAEPLVSLALRQRPEMARQAASIGAANLRLRQEQTRPLFPLLSIGYSAGAFGGGSNQTALGVDSFFQRMGSRDDLDVSVIWTLQNMGAGNVALARERRAERDQLLGGQSQLAAQVRREVMRAYSDLQAQRRRIDVNEQQLAAGERGAREEILRTRAGEGLPIESLNSVKLAADARQNAIDAVVQYNIAQFRLFVAIGRRPVRPPDPIQQPQQEVLVPLPEVLGGAQPRDPLENPVP
jgi:outer membrane protein TolC